MNSLFTVRRFLIPIVLSALGWTTSQAQDLPELRIGVVLSESGGASGNAASAMAVLQMLEDELATTESLPFKVRFFHADDRSDTTTASESVKRLVREDRVHALICCTTRDASIAVGKLANEERVPLMSIGAGGTTTGERGEQNLAHSDGMAADVPSKFVFNTQMPERLLTRHMLDYMRAKNLLTVALVARSDAGGRNALIDFSKLAEEQGIEVVAAESFSARDTNFNVQAMRIAIKKPDVVFFHSLPPAAALAHESLRRTGYTGPFFHGGDIPSAAVLAAAGDDAEGSIFASAPLAFYKQLPKADLQRPTVAAFVKAYEASGRLRRANNAAAEAHDAVMMAVQAWHRIPVLIQEGKLPGVRLALQTSIERTRNYVGAIGIFSYSPNDHRGLDSRSTHLAVLKKGRLELLEK